jgi:hypothetical protein
MKLRLIPIAITLVTTGVLLFGGWFVYHSVAMENPLTHAIEQAQGVQQVQTQINNDTVTFELKLANDASLRDLYNKITTAGSSIIGKREVNLKVDNEPSPALEQWWSNALFEIAQAMETRQYAQIPQILQSQSIKLPGLNAATEMDETNVYIRLTEGTHSKYIILPRVPAKIGVWPN